MFYGYKKSGSLVFVRNVMLDMQKMQAELKEHRYYLEQNVERRTENLLKRLAMLESCNAALCDKLAQAQQELIALKRQPAQIPPNIDAESNDRSVKLYVMSNQARKPFGSNAQESWGEHATAA